MLKRLIIGAVIIALLLPAFWGQVLVHQYYRVDNKIQQKSALRLTDASHAAGWQQTQILRQYQLPNHAKLDMHHDVEHGGFPWQALQVQTQIFPDLKLQQNLNKTLGLPFKQPVPLQIQTQVHSPTHIQGQFQLEPSNLGNYLQGQFQYQQQRFSLEQQLQKIAVRGIHLDEIRQQLQWDKPRFNSQIQIASLSTDKHVPFLSTSQTEKIQLDVNILQQGVQLWDLALKLDSMALQQQQIILGQLDIDMQAQRLHQVAFKQGLALLQASDFQRKLMMPLFLLQHAPTFLRHAPELHIKQLQIDSNKGQLQLSARLKTADEAGSKLFNLFDLFQSLSLQVDLRMDGQWLHWLKNPNRVRQAPALYQLLLGLKDLEKQGWLEVDGDKALMKIRFEDGQFSG